MSDKTICMWEIFVPTIRNEKPVSTKHHREWDKFVMRIAGGLSIFKPLTAGKWVRPEDGLIFEERMIPVRVACTEKQINRILTFTIQHYSQHAALAYLVSEKVIIQKRK